MGSVSKQDFVGNLLRLLRETFEGTGGQGSHFIDGRGHGSFLETLDRLGHEVASRPLRSGGATIAAHSAHTLYYLRVLQQLMRGEDVPLDWPGSWRTRTVSEAEWRNLRTALRHQYHSVASALQDVPEWDDDAVSDALSMLAHSAYHLGAIRLLAVSLTE